MFGLFGKLHDVTEGTFRQEIHALPADDDHVVVLADFSEDKLFTSQQVFVWHLRDGRATECWAIPVDQAGAAAALA